jgi:hypothetical protein
VLHDHDRSDADWRCWRVDSVISTARAIYYGKRLLDLLKKSLPPEPVP